MLHNEVLQGVFKTFYCAGVVVDHGQNPYLTEPLRGCERVARLPQVTPANWVEPAPLPGYDLAVLAVIAKLPLRYARLIFSLATLVSMIVAAWMLARLTKLPAVTILIALAPLSLLNYAYGELPTLSLFAIVAAGYFLAKQRYWWAALAVSASVLQPHVGLPAFVSLFLWVPSCRKGLIVGLLALIAMSVAAIGVSGTLSYLQTVLPAQAVSELVANDQYSLTRLLYVAGIHGPLALRLGSISYFVMLIVGCLLARRASQALAAPELIVFIPAAAVLLGGVFVHDVQMIAALPAAIVIAAKARPDFRLPAYIGLVLLAVVWTQQPGKAVLVLNAAAIIALGLALLPGSVTSRVLKSALVAVVLCVALVALHRDRHAMALITGPFDGFPQSLAAETWGNYLRATPALTVPRISIELEKIPTWAGIIVVLVGAGLSGRKLAADLASSQSPRIGSDAPVNA